MITPHDVLYTAAGLSSKLRKPDGLDALSEVTEVLVCLRDKRMFNPLCDLAETVCSLSPENFLAKKLLMQGLIETGRLTSAIGIAEAALPKVKPEDKEYDELHGLLGRAYKQLFVDLPYISTERRMSFLTRSWENYAVPFKRDPVKNFWHGINLAALSHAARAQGIDVDWDAPASLARGVIERLDGIASDQRDHYWYATLAEAQTAVQDWEAAEAALQTYTERTDGTAFGLASMLRQFRELWTLGSHEEGLNLLQQFEALLLKNWRPDELKTLTLQVTHLRALQSLSQSRGNHQHYHGTEGTETIEWYRAGLKCAGAVAAIEEHLGIRFGTGFAVKAGDIGLKDRDPDEVLLLTNHHVLNSKGAGKLKGLRQVRVKFEALPDGVRQLEVGSVISESPTDGGLDYTLVTLKGDTAGIPTLTLNDAPESVQIDRRVYVIGCPLGQVLQISLHDGRLIDHECPEDGKPPVPDRRRLHYNAATAPGSSGSPIFDERWQCIGLHHAGGKVDPMIGEVGLCQLNGGLTMVEANQGIWMGSVIEHIRKTGA